MPKSAGGSPLAEAGAAVEVFPHAIALTASRNTSTGLAAANAGRRAGLLSMRFPPGWIDTPIGPWPRPTPTEVAVGQTRQRRLSTRRQQSGHCQGNNADPRSAAVNP